MNIYSFTKMPKQLLVLLTMLGIGAVSVSPALADNHTDSMESNTENQMPLDESSTDMETPMDESSTDMETPMDETSTDMEAPMDETGTDIETPMDETGTDIETPMDETGTDLEETPVDETGTDMETPLDETGTDLEQAPLNETGTDIETPVDETGTDIETPLDESSTDLEQAPVDESSTDLEQAPVGESATEAGNIVEVASGSGNFNTLVQAIQAAGLADTLSDSSASYTVFAPTDEAFSQLPDGTLEYLLQPENKEVLQQVLSYHVLPEKLTSEEISGSSLDSLAGGLATAVTDKGVVINNASVINPDVQASNGIIHGINRVLLPADLQTTLASELGVNEADIYQ